MYSTEIASFLGSLQKISVDEYMLYSVVLLQGCGLMYKVIMWRLGCKRNGNKKKAPPSYNDVEKQLNSQADRIVVVPVVPKGRGFAVQPAETKKGHSITVEREEDNTV